MRDVQMRTIRALWWWHNSIMLPCIQPFPLFDLNSPGPCPRCNIKTISTFVLQTVSSLPSTMSFNSDIVLGYSHSDWIFETRPYFVHLGLCLWEPGQVQWAFALACFCVSRQLWMLGSVHRRNHTGMWVQGSLWRIAKQAPGSLLLPPLQTRQLDVEGFILRSRNRFNSLIFRPAS
jgi:hypothetical protein